MQSLIFSLLPSIAVLLLCSISAHNYGVLAFPVAIPKHPPGSRVVIVVGGNGSDGMSSAHPLQPPPSMMTSESQVNQVKSMSLFPTQEHIKRQGLLNIKSTPTAISSDLLNKRENSWASKHIPTSPRHISGVPSDIFRQGKMLSIEKHTEPGPQITDFRPHQPDITHHMQSNNGKLSLPIGFTDDNGLGGGGLGSPSPTPMANKINPYTNGVAASFPPGIDPYEGFIRYAAENLDTPMGNIVDYHSLEHYYGQQHPLSPYQNSKEAGTLQNHPYADSFSYNNNNNEIETGNSPPPPPPPHSPPHDGFGDGPGPGPGPGPNMGDNGGGFRPRHNSMDRGHGRPRENHHHSVKPQYTEHGIDHFHAPSPGLGAAPPRPRPPHNFDPALHEEEHGHRSPPFEPPPGYPQYTQNHHSPPFKHPNSEGINSENELGHAPDPPDLDVYEEGPPPPGSHPPLPDPTHQGQNPNHSPPGGPEQENNDGGDDAIWGILDLAEMLEKGQIPGQSGNTASASPSGAGGKNIPKGRLVVPVFTRPPPPRIHNSPNEGPSEDPDDTPPHIPPSPNHSPNTQQTPNGFPGPGAAGPGAGDGGFDYDESPGGSGRPGFGGSLDSQEANDYGDDVYSK